MSEARSTRLKLGEYEVWVVVEGEEVEHYKIELDELQRTATCWIASEQGKRFAFRTSKSHTLFDCAVNIRLDGNNVGGRYLVKDSTNPNTVIGITTGQHTARVFAFDTLKVTDDESSLQDPDAVKNIGEMQIVIHHVSDLMPVRPAQGRAVPALPDVHERAKKATPHRVQYGQPIMLPMATERSATYVEQVAKFVIRYTSLDMLQAMGIAERRPTPLENTPRSTLPSSRNKGKRRADAIKFETLSDVELTPEEREERQKEAMLEAELEELKEARATRSQERQARKRVKLETGSRRLFIPGEVIDLT